jgi:predicted site-specific integrase-resolvase
MSDVPKARRVFSVNELATMFGVATDSIYRAVHSGKLRPLAGFGKMMFSDKEVERFLGATRKESAP